jgi:ribosome maturation factor RimP
MDKVEKIAELEKFIGTRLGDMGFELIDLRLMATSGREILELYCDRLGDERIDVDDCAAISERLKYTLQAEGFFPDDYSLIVSSPGLDRVVKKAKDFERFNGRTIKLFLSRIAGGGIVVGKLVGYNDGRVSIQVVNGDLQTYEPDQYKLVRLVPELEGFEKIQKRIKVPRRR